jgi:hypothetical protein
MRVAVGHIGRVGNDEVEAPAGQREPVAFVEIDFRAQAAGIVAGDRQRPGDSRPPIR